MFGVAAELMGSWYAGVLFWKPRVVLLVNESTLLPVLMPLAPARTLTDRVGEHITAVLAAHHTPPHILDQECRQLRDCQFGTTTNRSVVGMLTEFTYLTQAHHDHDPDTDLLDLALRLAATPCGPLYRRHVSPDRELAAMLRDLAAHS